MNKVFDELFGSIGHKLAGTKPKELRDMSREELVAELFDCFYDQIWERVYSESDNILTPSPERHEYDMQILIELDRRECGRANYQALVERADERMRQVTLDDRAYEEARQEAYRAAKGIK